MIRIATPDIANDLQERKPLSFDRLRHGMIGPASGIVYYAPAAVVASTESTQAEAAESKKSD
jgi:hypothetical protein